MGWGGFGAGSPLRNIPNYNNPIHPKLCSHFYVQASRRAQAPTVQLRGGEAQGGVLHALPLQQLD